MLSGLELAKYVLMRIADNQSIEKISEDFDDDIQFIKGIVILLKDTGWIVQD